MIREMVTRQEDMKVPTELLPVCPYCGKPLTMNLRSDNKFVEDEGWHAAAERYENFLRTREEQKILFLELGVGYNTPVIIKYPFWQMTAKNPNAIYACINQGQAVCPREMGNGTQYDRITAARDGSTFEWVATAENGWHAAVVGARVGWVSGKYSKLV